MQRILVLLAFFVGLFSAFMPMTADAARSVVELKTLAADGLFTNRGDHEDTFAFLVEHWDQRGRRGRVRKVGKVKVSETVTLKPGETYQVTINRTFKKKAVVKYIVRDSLGVKIAKGKKVVNSEDDFVFGVALFSTYVPAVIPSEPEPEEPTPVPGLPPGIVIINNTNLTMPAGDPSQFGTSAATLVDPNFLQGATRYRWPDQEVDPGKVLHIDPDGDFGFDWNLQPENQIVTIYFRENFAEGIVLNPSTATVMGATVIYVITQEMVQPLLPPAPPPLGKRAAPIPAWNGVVIPSVSN